MVQKLCNSTKLSGTVHLCLDPTNKCVLLNITRCEFRLSQSKFWQKIIIFLHVCMSTGRYRLTRLPFGVAPVGDMLQWKIDEIFKEQANNLGIPDDILIADYYDDGR